jgi:hypothetical protein
MGDWTYKSMFFYIHTNCRWIVTFTARPLLPRERTQGTHSIGGCVRLRIGLDDMNNREFLSLPGL